MSRNEAHFRISRSVESNPGLMNKVAAICVENITEDLSQAVFMPVMKGSEDNIPHGEPRYKILRSLTLPILDIARPEPPYRRVFNHAAYRFDDGGRTVDAQVSEKIAKRWGEILPQADPTHLLVESKGLVTDIMNNGYQLSARIEDNAGGFHIDFDAVQEFLQYIAKMKQYEKYELNFDPEIPFEPKIPLVKFSDSVSDDEVGRVFEQLEAERLNLFTVGELMPPKVY